MSVHASAYVWEHSQQKGTELLLMLAIADIAHKNGVAFPSVATLARFIRMSDRNTTRVLKKLERSGELEIRRNAGPHGTHLFRIRMDVTLPLFGPGDKLAHDNLSGDNPPQKGVTKDPTRGDTAASAEPKEQKAEPGKGRAPRGARLPADFKISDNVRAWAKKHGHEPYLQAHFEYFLLDAQSRSNAIYVDFDKALMKSITADWGGVRKQAQMQARHGGQAMGGARQIAEWWETRPGLDAKAKEIGIKYQDRVDVTPGENAMWLRARIYAALGDGPWSSHDKSSTFADYLKRARELYEAAHA